MARLRYNGLSSTLGADLTNDQVNITFATSLTHSGGLDVPTLANGDIIPLSILDETGRLAEVVALTAYTAGATTGTILRGQEGTSGDSHSTGSRVVHAITKTDLLTDIDVENLIGEFGANPADFVPKTTYDDRVQVVDNQLLGQQQAIQELQDAPAPSFDPVFRGVWAATEVVYSDNFSDVDFSPWVSTGNGNGPNAIVDMSSVDGGTGTKPAFAKAVAMVRSHATLALDTMDVQELVGKALIGLRFWAADTNTWTDTGAPTVKADGAVALSLPVPGNGQYSTWQQYTATLPGTVEPQVVFESGDTTKLWLAGVEFLAASDPYLVGQHVIYQGKIWRSVVDSNASVPGADGNWVLAGTFYDAESVRDAIHASIKAGTGVTVTVDDAADTVTIAATGGSGGATASPPVVIASTTAKTNGSSIGITVPAGSQAGDLLVIFVGADYDTNGNPPAGWTQLARTQQAFHNASIFVRTCAADTESGATVTVPMSGGGNIEAACLTVRNVSSIVDLGCTSGGGSGFNTYPGPAGKAASPGMRLHFGTTRGTGGSAPTLTTPAGTTLVTTTTQDINSSKVVSEADAAVYASGVSWVFSTQAYASAAFLSLQGSTVGGGSTSLATVKDWAAGLHVKDEVVVDNGYLWRARAGSAEQPLLTVAAPGAVNDPAKWTTTSVASVSSSGTPEVVLINNASSDNGFMASVASFPVVGDFPLGQAYFDLSLTGTADGLNIAVVDASQNLTNWTDLQSDSGQGFGAWGVYLDIYNNRVGQKTSNKDTSNSVAGNNVGIDPRTPQGAASERWIVDYSEPVAGTITMTLYRAGGATRAGLWTFPKPTGANIPTTFRLAASARTGGSAGRFSVLGSPIMKRQSSSWQRLALLTDAT